MVRRAPAMYISHGSPMLALQPGKAGTLLKEFGYYCSEVKAVLIISPHWMSEGLAITSGAQLETIHDFYGFPDSLYEARYNAPGDQAIATKIQQHLNQAGYQVNSDAERGRDHGAWVPMIHLLPEAVAPVLQLSLDRTLDAEGLIKLGENLRPLREQGIAIIASGSLTHNLSEIQPLTASPVEYAVRFQSWVREQVKKRDLKRLSEPALHSDDFKRAHPTDEHYLPLLIALGASDPEDQLHILEGGILHGVLSMESYGWV